MHLNTEVALDLIEGRLEPEQESFWKRHMEICGTCAMDILRWKEIRVDLKRSHLASAPEQDVEKTLAIFPAPEPRSTIRSVLASIIFDSLLQPALAGARGSVSPARQLVLHVADFDIHIKLWGTKAHRQMIGQLLPRETGEFVGSIRCHLIRNGEKIESTVTDQLGEFRFSDVPEGDLSLQLDLPNVTIIGALNIAEEKL